MTIDLENLTPQVLIDNPEMASEVVRLEMDAIDKRDTELCKRLGQVVDALLLYRGEGKLPPASGASEPGR